MNQWGKYTLWYLLSVLVALSFFSSMCIILPAFSDKTSWGYHVLFFFFTLGAVILLFFAAHLIRDGLKGMYRGLSLLIKALRNHP